MIVFLFLVLAVRDFSSLRTHFRPFICVHHSATKEKNRERFRKNGKFLGTTDYTDATDCFGQKQTAFSAEGAVSSAVRHRTDSPRRAWGVAPGFVK